MRLQGESNTEGDLWRVTISLGLAEAEELRDALEDLLDAKADPAWHAHVPSGDFRTELIVTREAV